jgi:DNA-binding transcriptional MerR regulator
MVDPNERDSKARRIREYLDRVAQLESVGDLMAASQLETIPDADEADRARDHALNVSGALAVLRSHRPQSPGTGIPGTAEPPRPLYRASEIAAYFGLSRQTIHNYTTMGLITEEDRTEGNHRLYDESVFSALARIQRLKATHRLQDIRRLLEADERTAARRDFADATPPTHTERDERPNSG